MPWIYDMGPTALLPLRRKACWGFFRPEKPANLGTKGQHATSRPPKPLLSLLFPTRFSTFSLNVDSILPYTEVASYFQSETLTVHTVTSTNSTDTLVTHWTLVSAWWLLLTRCRNLLWSFPLTATTRLSHHGIFSHATPRRGCLKTTTSHNFALWLFL